MKPTLKVLFVFNRSSWSTINFKLQQIREFFSSKVNLVTTVVHTNFVDIPFETVQTIDGTGSQNGVDTHGSSETVKDSWFDANIVVPMAKGYDIVVFCISNEDKAGHLTSAGIRGDRDQGAVECIIFGGEENYRTYVNNVDIGNNFVVFSTHEISHAIYMILAKKDNTHLYFYSGHPEKVLEDFVFPVPNNTEKITLLTKLLGLYQQLLALVIKQKEIPTPINNKIELFCKSIQKKEGFSAPTPEKPKGSRSWRNNNPGNFKYIGQYKATGQDSGGFAIFPSYQIGYDYLYKVIENTCKGLSKVRGANYTIYEFFIGTPQRKYRDGYAPEEDHNDPTGYAEFVANEVGVSPYTKMKDLL